MKDMNMSINLNTIEKVKQFITVTTKHNDAEFDIAPDHGRISVDGKSIMGIFSLDISKPLTLLIHAPENILPAIQTELQPFVA